MVKHLLYILLLFISSFAAAQLDDGSVAPNFVVTDTNGESHELYNYLQEGRTVVIYFMATWSDPCWSYHNGLYNGTNGTGALTLLHNAHAVENGGNVVVLMIEGDPTTNLECLVGGPGCNLTTHGDWTMDTPYPVIDSHEVAELYQIEDYPLVMTICPNGFLTETGTLTASSYWFYIQNSDCPQLLDNDAALQYPGSSSSSCEEELIVEVLNLGGNPQTALNISSTGISPPIDYDWTGDLQTFESETINFGVISTIEGEEITLAITSVDDNPANNTIAPGLGAIESSTHIHLELQSDTYPEDFSFHIYDENGAEVVTDGGWGPLGADALIVRDYFLPDTGCYRVELLDSYGDGLFEGAYCKVHGIDADGNDMDLILDVQTGEFSEVKADAKVISLIVVSNLQTMEKAISAIEVYPNPASEQLNLTFTLTRPGKTQMELVTAMGKVAHSEYLGNLGSGNHFRRIDLDKVAAGSYMLNISCDGESTGTRLMLK